MKANSNKNLTCRDVKSQPEKFHLYCHLQEKFVFLWSAILHWYQFLQLNFHLYQTVTQSIKSAHPKREFYNVQSLVDITNNSIFSNFLCPFQTPKIFPEKNYNSLTSTYLNNKLINLDLWLPIKIYTILKH